MTFKDSCNLKSNQTAKPVNVIHLSNLCTEIAEVSSKQETAVCNLGSINLAKHVNADGFDFEKLAQTVRTAVKFLDRVIDINFYPIGQAADSNKRWRPVGLGLMGLQDVFFTLRLPFDSERAREISRRVQEEIYFHALSASCALAAEYGAHAAFADTRAAEGVLQFDAWGVRPSAENLLRWAELKRLGLWNETMRNRLKLSDGSIQSIGEIPEEIRALYRTAREIPLRSLIDMAAE